MADIIVTTPKSEHFIAQKEAKFIQENPDAFWFRTLKGRPNVRIGDRVYYVDNGMIVGYGIVFDIKTGNMYDDAHSKIWIGTHLKQREWHWLKDPVSFKGFQGFRYVDRIEWLKEKLK